MATVQRMDTAISLFVKKEFRDIHTSVPAKVGSVDYGAGTMEAMPTVSTVFENGDTDTYPALFDIPIMVLSGNGGKAKITFPITAGDPVGVVFSEKNPNNSSDTSTHGLFPNFATTVGGEIDPVNVILMNDVSIITLQPDGTVKITSGAGNLEVQPSGNIMANGATITPDGNIITAQGVNLNDFYQDYLNHRHSGVETGNGNTGTKV